MPAMSNLSLAVAAISSPALRGGGLGIMNQASNSVQQMPSHISPLTRGQAGMRSQPHQANLAHSYVNAGSGYSPRHPMMQSHATPSQVQQVPMQPSAAVWTETPDPMPRMGSDLSPATPERTPRRSTRQSTKVQPQTPQSPQQPSFMVNAPGGPIYS